MIPAAVETPPDKKRERAGDYQVLELVASSSLSTSTYRPKPSHLPRYVPEYLVLLVSLCPALATAEGQSARTVVDCMNLR